MKISEAGVELIKRFEGLELESYLDIAGVWTIGYGHTETAGPNQKISAREADELLRRDLAPRERAVEQLVSVSLNQNEFDALVSFIFNVGIGAFKTSTARKRLNRNDRIGAADAITWWNKATVGGVLREVLGLTRRRAAERALFLMPVNPPIVNKPDSVSENSRATPVEEPPRRENIGESRTIQGAAVAGGAGAAASTIGKQSAEELGQLETNIEQGTGLTEKPPGQGGLGDPVTSVGGPVGEGSSVSEPSSDGGATDGAATDGVTAGDATEGGETADGAESGAPSDSGSTSGETIQAIEMGPERPSAREKNAVDAQLQFALLIVIALATLYIIFARIDDWWRYRR